MLLFNVLQYQATEPMSGSLNGLTATAIHAWTGAFVGKSPATGASETRNVAPGLLQFGSHGIGLLECVEFAGRPSFSPPYRF